MAADVVERAQLAVEAMGDDDRLVEDRDGDEVPHPLELIGPCHQLPGPPEDALLLRLEDLGVDVVARGQGRGPAERRRGQGARHPLSVPIASLPRAAAKCYNVPTE